MQKFPNLYILGTWIMIWIIVSTITETKYNWIKNIITEEKKQNVLCFPNESIIIDQIVCHIFKN